MDLTYRTTWRVLALCVPATVGCNDSLVDADYRATTLFSAPFEVEGFDSYEPDANASPRWGLFLMPGGLRGEICDIVEHPGSSQPLRFETTELNVFTAPTAAHWVTAPSGEQYALLRAMAYEDSNGNDRYDAGEKFIGDSNGGLMYLPKAVDEATGPTGVALPAGFHNVFWGGPCDAVPRGEEDCDVNLGQACTRDADCGSAGQCLTTKPTPGWAGGYCTRQAVAGECAPRDGRLYVHRNPDSGVTRLWLKACSEDGDCREQDGYTCNAMLGACLRAPKMRVVLGRPSKKSVCNADYRLATSDDVDSEDAQTQTAQTQDAASPEMQDGDAENGTKPQAMAAPKGPPAICGAM